jgi:hypothetical protein
MTGFLLDTNASELWDAKLSITKAGEEENSTEKQITELRKKNQTLEWQVKAGKYYRNLSTKLRHAKTASIILTWFNSAILLSAVIFLSSWKGAKSDNNNENAEKNLSTEKLEM